MRFARYFWLFLSSVFTLAAASPLEEPQTGSLPACEKPLYLTFDTGHMGVAQGISQVLREQGVRVTFFVANEPTQEGDGSLGEAWKGWWQERAKEGHEFASHTLNHVYWLQDLPSESGVVRFKVRASAGPEESKIKVMTAQEYCAAVQDARHRIEFITGKPALPLFRAPGGKTSPALLAQAQACGYLHVGWSEAGFLGDELPSEKFSNAYLLKKALANIRSGDILMAHLGIWSRHDPWAPANLKPLIAGLKAKGFCFRTLSEHPVYRSWIEKHPA
jgi:peptidoglycan/xylan/chitin deacetylase (PgdA/CDA1 family)